MHLGEIEAIYSRYGEGSNAPFLRRLRELRRVFGEDAGDSRLSDSAISSRLAMVPPQLTGAPVWRPLVHACVVILLFSGILGTFFGLMEMVTNDQLLQLLRRVGSFGHNGQSGDLSPILDGLKSAFSANIISYVLYVAGRLVLDLYEDEFEQRGAIFVETVQAPLIEAYPTNFNIGKVDLTDEAMKGIRQAVAAIGLAVTAMQTVAETVNAASAATKEVVTVAKALLPQIGATASAMEAQSQAMTVAVGSVVDGWKAAAETVSAGVDNLIRTATESLNRSEANTEASFHAFDQRMESLLTAFSEAAASASGYARHVDDVTAEMAGRVEEETKELVKHVGALQQTFGNAVDDVHGRVRSLSATLDKQLIAFKGVGEALQAAVADVAKGNQALLASSHQQSQLLTGLEDRFAETWKKRFDAGVKVEERMVAAFSAYREVLNEVKTGQNQLREMVAGSSGNTVVGAMAALERQTKDALEQQTKAVVDELAAARARRS